MPLFLSSFWGPAHYIEQGHDVRVVCSDGPLKNSLPKNLADKIFSTVPELIKALEFRDRQAQQNSDGSSLPSNDEEGTPHPLLSTAIDANSDFLSSLIAEDKQLMLRMLGYVYWFSRPNPLGKNELYQHMLNKGYSREITENMAQRLSLNGALKDIGAHYIPNNQSLCKRAASEVMPEILELLDQG